MKIVGRLLTEQMPAVHDSVDNALVPSRYEPFGYVALVAMASGLPMIEFSGSGTSEVCVYGAPPLRQTSCRPEVA